MYIQMSHSDESFGMYEMEQVHLNDSSEGLIRMYIQNDSSEWLIRMYI